VQVCGKCDRLSGHVADCSKEGAVAYVGGGAKLARNSTDLRSNYQIQTISVVLKQKNAISMKPIAKYLNGTGRIAPEGLTVQVIPCYLAIFLVLQPIERLPTQHPK
jgi:hypothetical protein